MKTFNKSRWILIVGAIISGQVVAYEAGDIIVRAGYAAVDPRDSSTDLNVSGTKLGGTGVGVDGAAALGVTATYMLTPHWGVELLVATPFKHDVTTKGLGGLGVADGTKLGNTKQLPPTLSVQFYFAESASDVQPYVGLGLNYTTFFDEGVSGAAQSALGASNFNLDDSFGLAAEVGIDWHINRNWLLNASVWRVQIETDASLDTALGRIKTEVTIDPWVYMLGVGYRF